MPRPDQWTAEMREAMRRLEEREHRVVSPDWMDYLKALKEQSMGRWQDDMMRSADAEMDP